MIGFNAFLRVFGIKSFKTYTNEAYTNTNIIFNVNVKTIKRMKYVITKCFGLIFSQDPRTRTELLTELATEQKTELEP